MVGLFGIERLSKDRVHPTFAFSHEVPIHPTIVMRSVNREEVSRIVREVLANHAVSPDLSSHAPSNGPNTCRAAVLSGPGKIEIRTFPIRDISDDEILIRVEGCGICGTDVHEFRGDPMGLAPLVLGHEGTGEVVKLGKNVSRDNGGKPVAVGDRRLPARLRRPV